MITPIGRHIEQRIKLRALCFGGADRHINRAIAGKPERRLVSTIFNFYANNQNSQLISSTRPQQHFVSTIFTDLPLHIRKSQSGKQFTMTSYRQIEANRRNALKSTGPNTEAGKQISRCNAVRHGLTAETVITALEDVKDYKTFEAAITADYDAQSAVERQLVLRLAGVLWRLRRATAMETGLFEIQGEHQNRQPLPNSREVINVLFGSPQDQAGHCTVEFARCFLRLASLPSFALDRLSRYEARLWR